MSQRFCTFWVGELFLGVEVERIQEVLRVERLTPVPLAPPEVGGLINLRGQILTAIDLRREFAIDVGPVPQNNAMHLILSEGTGVVSFIVDRVGDVVDVTAEDFEDPPETLKGDARKLIRGAYKLADRLMLVVNADYAADLSAHN
jgi:purine-binding chemotaxis protein CheW